MEAGATGWFSYMAAAPQETVDDFYKKMSIDVAMGNLRLLATFIEGDKPVIAADRVTIIKEDRQLFVAIRRAWTKAFNPFIIEASFEKLCDVRRELANLSRPKTVAELYEALQDVDELGSRALDGLRNLRTTYYKEAVYYISKPTKAYKLLEIGEKYRKILSDPPRYEPHHFLKNAEEIAEIKRKFNKH